MRSSSLCKTHTHIYAIKINTQTYFKFSLKIPLVKNFVIKSIHLYTKKCNKLCVFIWYMMNLNYKSIYFIHIKGVF